jgi:hypothetical protein
MSKTKNENIEVIVEDIGDAIIPDYDDFEWDEDLYGEDAPTQIIEGYQDKEIVGGNNSDNLQTAYIEYNSDFEELVKLLTTIIETGEYTEEHKATVNAKNGEYDESYSKVKREISKAQTVSLQNQINDIKSEMLTGTQSEIFNALTKNGAVQGLYLDDNGDIYINAQFLQTRGMSIVNNNNETTLAIDEEGNLTTSGDIVGGTITGAIMRAMKIDTNEVNIESADGGMTIKGALQKFTDENGNVRILIGKDTDGSFKFMLYGENGSTVLIDKNGIKSEAISAGTIKTEHLTPNSISTKHLKTDVMEAIDAKVENMTADKATIGQLNATNANIGTLQTNVAKIDNILAGNITSENIQAGSITSKDLATGTITAGSGIIADGAIGSAQISEINAGKINGGTVDTSKVTVAGANNHLKIQGNRLQVFQGVGSQAKERVSVGDVNGDGTVYGLRVRGADGRTVLMDENGVKSEGITDGSITNDKISDDANIDGAKININSVISKINEDGTETINGTKIEVDGQALNTKLSTITIKQNEDSEKISQAQSQISANTQSIGLKVDSQTYQTDKKNMTSQMNKNTSAIDVLQGQIALKVERTDIEDAVTDAKNELDKDIKNLSKRIDDVLADVGGAIVEGALDEAKCNIISNTVTQLNTEKAQLLGRFEYLYSNSDLNGTTKTNLLNNKNNFVTAHTNLVDTIERIVADKHITSSEKNEYNNKVIAYSNSLTVFVKILDESLQVITNNKITSAKAEIKLTTDAITQNVSNLTKTVEKKADGSTVNVLNNKVTTLETGVSGINSKVETLENKQNTVSGKVTSLETWKKSAEQKITDSAIINTVKSSTTNGKNTFVQQSDITQLNDSWTAKFDDGYSQGVTTINKNGVTVTASNVKSKTNMSADGLKIIKTDTGEEVFKVNSDGTLSIKGNITVTGGTVPANSLSGTISSNQLNSSITSDINTAKNNASSALNTANSVSATANSALSTAKNAQSTANSAQSTANNTNNILNNNKDNWSNAYNRVKEWANGAVTGSTSINGGMIATNTVTANKIAVGDFNNYSQLQKGRNLTNTYGNAIWSEVNAEWTTSNAYFPLTLDNTDNAFNVGDKINIKCSVWVNQSANLPIGVWFYDSNKTNTGSNTSTKTINAGWNHLDFELILNHDSIKKSPYMQILIKTEGNSIAVKDVVITRKISGEMLVDGAITANKLHADAINGKKITGVNIVGSTFSSTSGNFKVLNDGTVDATSLSVNDEISTETLTVQEINNSKYQAVLDRNVIINIDSGGTNSASFTSGATYKSISAFLDACPRCLNGYTVTLNLLSNINENVEINQLHSGSLTINMNGKVIYGYVFLEGESTRFRIYGNKSGSTGGSTFGSIMPNIGMTQAGGCYSMVIHSTQGFFYDLKVYGGKSTDSNIGIRVANWASAYLSAIQFIGCYNGLRTYNLGRAYISSSSGTTTSYAFSAYHGGQVILNPTTQAGKAGATSHVFISNNSTVTSTGVTWSSSAVSGSNTNSSTTKVEKTVTINSTLGDSYRSTTYNSWKKDSTVRQGNYGYGNCEGCWFYGDQFVPYQNKEITKIEITIKRQAGGVAGAVTHTLKMHNHATRPSGRPTFSTALSKNFSLATNNSTTVVLTTTAEINAFKANKGFGLVPTAQNSTYYSVCSGSATVKITYKE